MNSKIKNLITAVNVFDKNAERLVIELSKGKQLTIKKMNTDQLEDRGIKADGSSIIPKYAESTKRRKRKLGQTTTHVTLKDKGDFHGSFEIVYGEDSFQLVSNDEKARWLIKRYGTSILGLTAQNIGNLSQILKPDFTELFFQVILR